MSNDQYVSTPAPPAAALDRAVEKLRAHTDPHISYASISHDEEAAALLAKLEAADRLVEACERLWALCVEEGFPWSEGSVQDELTALGFLVAKDMTGEDESEQCSNCEGDCKTCYRSIESLAAYRNPQPRFTCASCAHQWDEDTIWCPKCRNGYRNPQPKEPT